MEQKYKEALCAILNVKPLDLDFMFSECEAFEVDFKSLYDFDNSQGNVHQYIDTLHSIAIQTGIEAAVAEAEKRGLEFDKYEMANKLEDLTSIFTNFLESHLYIDNEEAVDKDVLQDFITKELHRLISEETNHA